MHGSLDRGVGSIERRLVVELLDDLVVAKLNAPRRQPRGVGDARRRRPAGFRGEFEQPLEVVRAGDRHAGDYQDRLGRLLYSLLRVKPMSSAATPARANAMAACWSAVAFAISSAAYSRCSGLGDDTTLAKGSVDHRAGDLRASRGDLLAYDDHVDCRGDAAKHAT